MTDKIADLGADVAAFLREADLDNEPVDAKSKDRVAERLAASLGMTVVATAAIGEMGAAAIATKTAAAQAAGAKAAAGTASAGHVAGSLGAAKGTAAAVGAGAAVKGGAVATAASGATLVGLLAKPAIIASFVVGSVVGGTTVAVVQPKLIQAPIDESSSETLPQKTIPQANRVEESTNEPVLAVAELAERLRQVKSQAPSVSPSKTGPKRKGSSASREEVRKPMAEKRVIPTRATSKTSTQTSRAVSDDSVDQETIAQKNVPSRVDRTLKAERSIIDIGRQALVRGNPVLALKKFEEHRRKYPRGTLREDRDGLRILALVRLGRTDEARTRFDTFEKNFPRSLLMKKLRSALR